MNQKKNVEPAPIEEQLIRTIKNASLEDRLLLAEKLENLMNSPADGMSGEQQIVNLFLRALGSVKSAKEQQDNVIVSGCVLIFENAALSSFGLGTLLEYYLPFDYQYAATKGEYNTMKAILDALKKPPLRPGDNLSIVFPAAFVEDREKVTDMLEDIMTECSYYGSEIPPDVRSLAEDIINSLKNVTAYECKRTAANAQPVKIADLLQEIDHEGDKENLPPWEF